MKEKKIDRLLVQIRSYNPKADFSLIRKAYQLASKIHQGQKRLSGEDLLDHLLAVASLAAEIKLDEVAITAALLHESVRQGNLTDDFLTKNFNSKVASYVGTLTKLSQTPLVPRSLHLAENLRKTFLLLAESLPVALVRLADRVENVRTISALPVKEQAWAARQALNLYSPIAEILGVYHFQRQLEDGALVILRPHVYRAITDQLALERNEMEKAVESMKRRLLDELARERIVPEKIFGRTKSTYSIWKKLLRYQKAGKVKDFLVRRVYDQMALMILVKKVADCYRVLGVVNKLFMPLNSEFDDYIARPKLNGYRAIHTVVEDETGRIFEIQIRTPLMHEENEFGQAAHLYYKMVGEKGVKRTSREKVDWVKRLSEWSKVSVEEIFSEKVLIFSPGRDVYELPVGSTPIDFAYAVHTRLGDQCSGAKVESKLVSLDYKLKSGQMVEIIPNKNKKAPSRDWLNFVVTRTAKREIAKHWRR